MDESSREPILTYLRGHSGRYGLEALREQLLQNGYTPDEVESAIRIFIQEEKSPPPRVWPKALLLAAIDLVLLLLMTLLTGLIPLYWLYGLQVLVGLGMSLHEESRPWGLGLLLGFFLFVGATVLLVGGFCALLLFR